MKIFIFLFYIVGISSVYAYSNKKLLTICEEVPSHKCVNCCKIITHLSNKKFIVNCPSDMSKPVPESNKVLKYLIENSVDDNDIPGATYFIYKAMVENYSCSDLKVFFTPMLRKTLLISSCLRACKKSPVDKLENEENIQDVQDVQNIQDEQNGQINKN